MAKPRHEVRYPVHGLQPLRKDAMSDSPNQFTLKMSGNGLSIDKEISEQLAHEIAVFVLSEGKLNRIPSDGRMHNVRLLLVSPERRCHTGPLLRSSCSRPARKIASRRLPRWAVTCSHLRQANAVSVVTNSERHLSVQ